MHINNKNPNLKIYRLRVRARKNCSPNTEEFIPKELKFSPDFSLQFTFEIHYLIQLLINTKREGFENGKKSEVPVQA